MLMAEEKDTYQKLTEIFKVLNDKISDSITNGKYPNTNQGKPQIVDSGTLRDFHNSFDTHDKINSPCYIEKVNEDTYRIFFKSMDYTKWIERGAPGGKAGGGPRPFFTDSVNATQAELEDEIAEIFGGKMEANIDALIEAYFEK